MEQEREIEQSRLFILVVDEDGENLDTFRGHFREKFPLLAAGSADEAVKLISANEVALVVVEYSLPDRNGLELLEEASRITPDIIGILMSVSRNSDLLMQAINSDHVWKFMPKPWEPEEMENTLKEGIKRYRNSVSERSNVELLRKIATYHKKQTVETYGFDIIVGEDGDLADIMEKIRSAANAPMPVLFRGERGVGKELLARTMHRQSDRAAGPFIKLDALTSLKNIHESEIFGNEAEEDASLLLRGRVELAEGGTLFIDNVDELSPGAQFKLVELIKNGVFERVGGARQVKANARLVATTRGRLEKLVEARSFREDLVEALNVYPIDVPPLRSRRKDISALAQFLANRIARSIGIGSIRIDIDAVEKINSYPWPGNLNELACVLETAILNCAEDVLHARDIQIPVHAAPPVAFEPKRAVTHLKTDGDLKDRLAGLEREEIIEALKKSDGKKAQAARLLGINRSTLYYRMKKHGIE